MISQGEGCREDVGGGGWQHTRQTLALHTVKFELTNQHSVGGKNCGVLTSRKFCALRFDFCVISEVYTVEVRFYFSVFFTVSAFLTSVY